MYANKIKSLEKFEITGECFFRNDDWLLFIAISYIENEETKTIDYEVNEDTMEIIGQ